MIKSSKSQIRWMSFLLTAALLFGSLTDIGVALADDAPTDTPASQDDIQTEEPTSEPTEEPTTEPTTEPSETPLPLEVVEPVVGPPLLSEAEPPTTASPNGVIYSNTPTYTWNPVSDATRYYLYVYQVTLSGDIKIIDMNFRAGDICTPTICALRPATKLALGNYKWRVRAFYGNDIWGDYSTWQPFTYASTTPTARTPNGITYEQKPIFTWNEMPGVTNFQIQVYTNKGVLSHSQGVTSFSCASSRCSVESTKTFTSGKYYWRIRAQIGTTWYAYSASRNFVVTPEINSDFSSYSNDWKPFGGGTWTLSGGYFWTNGATGKMTSAISAYEYNDFEFEARMKREAEPTNTSFSANYLSVRMGTTKGGKRLLWYPGYLFGYTNAGNFSVWRISSSGEAVAMQPWTDTPFVIPNDWNTLRVVAQGQKLSFYINDDLVFENTDNRFSKGFVGFHVYKSSERQSRFWIDYARVTHLFEADSLATSILSPEQAALNLEAAGQPNGGTMLEYSTAETFSSSPPELYTPEGNTYLKKPRFTWEALDGVTQYRVNLQRIDVHGATQVFSRIYSAATICSLSECGVWSPVTLRIGNYQWKVQANAGGIWGDFSERKEFSVISTTPKQVSPKGTLYNEQRPAFIWTEIKGATRYQIDIWRRLGARIINKSLAEVECDEGLCRIDSPVTFPNQAYIWRVRAFLNGRWQPYSGWSIFTLGDLIDSDFETHRRGWIKLFGGTWALDGRGRYVTSGLGNKLTSARYAFPYQDFEFVALVRRESNPVNASQPANFIAVRMGSSSGGSNNAWGGGYLFGYTNAGEYSIWKMNAKGGATAIQPWTPSAVIFKNDWNLLKVVADGDTFEFYINNTLVRSFSDSAYSQGYVGFQMYQPADTSSRFLVDYAYLDLITTMSLAPASNEQIEPEQMLLNQEALADPAGDSIEGTP